MFLILYIRLTYSGFFSPVVISKCPVIVDSAVYCCLKCELYVTQATDTGFVSCSVCLLPLDGADNHNICPTDSSGAVHTENSAEETIRLTYPGIIQHIIHLLTGVAVSLDYHVKLNKTT